MSKSSKHIYASGCSYTEKDWYASGNGKGIGGWTMWPEHLGNHLGLPVINTGKSGFGNDYILAVSMRHILENYQNIELVAIAWSQASRYMVYDEYHFNPSVWLNGDPNDWYTKDKNLGYRFYENPYSHSQFLLNFINKEHNFYTLSSRFVRHVYTLQLLCETLNLKYIFAGAMRPLQLPEWSKSLENFDVERELKAFTKVDNFYDINQTNTIGWPFQPHIGGAALTDHPEFFPYGKNRAMPDTHPDANGQKIIAQQFIDHYEKIYG